MKKKTKKLLTMEKLIEELASKIQDLADERAQIHHVNTHITGTLNAISSRLEDIWNYVRRDPSRWQVVTRQDEDQKRKRR